MYIYYFTHQNEWKQSNGSRIEMFRVKKDEKRRKKRKFVGFAIEINGSVVVFISPSRNIYI